ncbi:hypothetical protein [Aneurinibacillus sp. REN35]|uniref:hypothetical protein n=1 Tax=Aneurinibacillus sp. REN35 TaxID=3237286 RepID=UPI00352717EC
MLPRLNKLIKVKQKHWLLLAPLFFFGLAFALILIQNASPSSHLQVKTYAYLLLSEYGLLSLGLAILAGGILQYRQKQRGIGGGFIAILSHFFKANR